MNFDLSPDQVFCEAKRTSPSILYIPHIQQWWDTAGPALRASFLSLLGSIPSFSPILLLATCSVSFQQLDPEVRTEALSFLCPSAVSLCVEVLQVFIFDAVLLPDPEPVSGGLRGGLRPQSSHPAGEDQLLPGSHSEPGSRGPSL